MTAERGLDTVTDVLRRDILDGTFGPGVRLVEADLCERYSASRPAVRNALLKLAVEELVERQNNRGAIVRRVSITEAIQITEARGALEGLVAASAARNATADERSELKGIGRQMRDAVGDGNVFAYTELNQLLHRRLQEVSRHQVAAHAISVLRNRATHHEFRLAAVPGRAQESLVQHERIIAAVVAGDEAAAVEAMTEHLASVADVLRRWTERPAPTPNA